MSNLYYWDKHVANESTSYATANIVNDDATFTVNPGYAFGGENYTSVSLNPNTGVLTFTGSTNPTASGTSSFVFYEKVSNARYRRYSVTYNQTTNNYTVRSSGFEVTTRVTYSKGAFIETITAPFDAYTNDARNQDGFWYVRGEERKGAVKGNVNGQIKNIVGARANIDGQIKKIIKAVYFTREPFTISPTLPVPFTVPRRDFSYQKYNAVISKFPSSLIENFGRDAGDTYDLNCVHVGTIGKPCLFVVAGIHGPEWQTTQYVSGFALDLINNTFPDKSYRDVFLQKYHIVFIPCLNPHGMDKFGEDYNISRRNANNIDLNRDFGEGEQTQAETQAFVNLFKKYKPFACIDSHMFGPGYDEAGGNYIIIGNGHSTQNIVRDSIAHTLGKEIGDSVSTWYPVNSPSSGLLRGFAARQPNPYNFNTLAYISEIERPTYPLENNTDGNSRYTNAEIFEVGYLMVYLFLLTSTMYYEHHIVSEKVEVYF